MRNKPDFPMDLFQFKMMPGSVLRHQGGGGIAPLKRLGKEHFAGVGVHTVSGLAWDGGSGRGTKAKLERKRGGPSCGPYYPWVLTSL